MKRTSPARISVHQDVAGPLTVDDAMHDDAVDRDGGEADCSGLIDGTENEVDAVPLSDLLEAAGAKRVNADVEEVGAGRTQVLQPLWQ